MSAPCQQAGAKQRLERGRDGSAMMPMTVRQRLVQPALVQPALVWSSSPRPRHPPFRGHPAPACHRLPPQILHLPKPLCLDRLDLVGRVSHVAAMAEAGLYDTDILLWSERQAALLRDR